jgi:DNA-binding HxlR family transcriptional regulator
MNPLAPISAIFMTWVPFSGILWIPAFQWNLSDHAATFRKEGTFARHGHLPETAMLRRPDPFQALCPTRRVLDRIGDTWAVLILIALDDGTLRFNELRRRIENISQKMLSQTLKSLERDGLVRREVFATVPVTVEYSLTELGRTLSQTVHQLTLWAETHIGEIEEAQQRYDRGLTPSAGGRVPLPLNLP